MEQPIFSWSLDGFGSKLFRITVNGNERFVNRYSSMNAEENGQEYIFNSEPEFNSFEEFWREFTDQPSWLRYRPVFIHNDYRQLLRDFFTGIDQESLTMSELFRLSLWLHKIE